MANSIPPPVPSDQIASAEQAPQPTPPAPSEPPPNGTLESNEPIELLTEDLGAEHLQVPPPATGPASIPPPVPTANPDLKAQQPSKASKSDEHAERDNGRTRAGVPVVEDPRLLAARTLAERWQAELEQTGESERKARLHFELAQLHERPLGNSADAAHHYLRACELTPDNLAAMRGARRLLTQAGRHEELLLIVDQELTLAESTGARIELLRIKGATLERHLDRNSDALSVYTSALELAPHDVHLLGAITRCQWREQAWDALADTYGETANAIEQDPALKAALLTQRAELLANTPQGGPEAVKLLQMALDLDPQLSAALPRLKELTERLALPGDLLAAVSKEAELAQNPRTIAIALHRASRIAAHALNDREHAITLLQTAVQTGAYDIAMLRALANAYEAGGRHTELAQSLVQLAEEGAAPKQRIADYLRAATLYEHVLRDPTTAGPLYEAAFALDSSANQTANAIADYYQRTENFEALVNVLARRATLDKRPERQAALHGRIADLLEHRLDRKPEAIQHHARATALDPAYDASFKALERLYAEGHAWRELAELYERHTSQTDDPPQREAYLFRLGALYEDRINEPASALKCYQRILREDPQHTGALQAAQRAAERAERYEDLLQVLEQELRCTASDERRLEILYRAARILVDHLNQPEAAIRRLTTVLEKQPAHAAALEALRSVYGTHNRWQDVIATYEHELGLKPDATNSAELHYHVAALSLAQLGDQQAAIAHCRSALSHDPAHAAAREQLHTLLRQTEDWNALTDRLRDEMSHCEEPSLRAHIALELGELCEHQLNDRAAALLAYQDATASVPDFAPAAEAASRLLRGAGRWPDLVDFLEQQASAMKDTRRALDARFRAAWLAHSKLNDRARAQHNVQWVLERAPGHRGALLALDAFLQDEGAARQQLLRTQASSFTDAGARLSALHQLIELQLAPLTGQPASGEAVDLTAIHANILTLDPEHRASIEQLAQQAERSAEPARAAELYAKLASKESNGAVIATHHIAAGECLESLDAARALASFRLALEHDPESRRACLGVLRVAEQLKTPDALSAAGRCAASILRDIPTAVPLLVRSAEAREASTEGQNAAAADLERALELEPENDAVVEKLKRTLLALDQLPHLIAVLTQAAELTHDRVHSATLHYEVAQLQSEYAQNLPAAIASTRRALKVEPNHMGALEHLCRLLERDQQWAEAARALEELAERSQSVNIRTLARQRAAELCDAQLEDHARAAKHYERLLELRPMDTAPLKALTRLYPMVGESEQALRMAELLLERSQNAAERGQAYLTIAAVRKGGDEQEAARNALEEALIVLGPESEAGDRLRSSAGKETSWRAYLAILKRHLSWAAQADEDLVPGYLETARVLARELDRPDDALNLLREAIDADPSNARLHLTLAEHLRATGDLSASIRELRLLLGIDPQQGAAWTSLAQLLAKTNHADEALAIAAGGRIVGADVPEGPRREARPASGAPGVFGDAGIRALQVHDALDAPAARLLAAAAEILPKLYPMDLKRFDVTRRDRIPANSEDPIRVHADKLARQLGVPAFDLYAHERPGEEVALVFGAPPALVAPAWLRGIDDSAQVFLLGRRMALLARELHAVQELETEELGLLLDALGRFSDPNFLLCSADHTAVDDRHKRAARALPRRARKSVLEAANAFTEGARQQSFEVQSWQADIQETAARVALLLADDIVTSVEVAVRATGTSRQSEGLANGLLRFWASETACAFRTKIRSFPHS